MTEQPQPNQTGSAQVRRGLPFVLTCAVAGLGAVIFLLGFTADTDFSALFLLAGALAVLSLLPGQRLTGVSAAVSATAFLGFVLPLFHSGSPISVGTYLVVVLGFVQATSALAAVLSEAGVLAAPMSTQAATRPSTPVSVVVPAVAAEFTSTATRSSHADVEVSPSFNGEADDLLVWAPPAYGRISYSSASGGGSASRPGMFMAAPPPVDF